MRRPTKQFSITLACILYCLLQSVSTHVFAAQAITPVQWQQLTADKAFTYKNDTEAVQPPIEYKPGLFAKAVSSFLGFLASKEGNTLLWIIIISIITYIIYKVFFHKDSFLFGRNKKIMNVITSAQEDEEMDLAATNWEELLNNAVHNSDFRLAVRYSYMWMLQIMQQRELIQYRIDKTNYEYYTELNDTGYKQPFKQLSRQYEYAWYGRFAMSQAAYSEYKELFDNIRKQLDA
ncbi:MAG: DUF4129 domain-containing protein [Chitinophagales bacterium]